MPTLQSKRYHVILDVSRIKPERILDAVGLERFLKELPGTIGMSVLHGPTIIEGLPVNPGLTGFVIIDYSHISIHTFSVFNEALVDVFSCKPYDKEILIGKVLEFFEVKREQANIKEVYWG